MGRNICFLENTVTSLYFLFVLFVLFSPEKLNMTFQFASTELAQRVVKVKGLGEILRIT